mgnify:CR=1 FL=1
MKLNGNTYIKLEDVIECLDNLTNEYDLRHEGAKIKLNNYHFSSEFPKSKYKIDLMKEKIISRHAQSLACMAAKSSVMKLK